MIGEQLAELAELGEGEFKFLPVNGRLVGQLLHALEIQEKAGRLILAIALGHGKLDAELF
jgi:hypothetical protein